MTAGTGVPRRRVLPTDLLRADSGAKARPAPPSFLAAAATVLETRLFPRRRESGVLGTARGAEADPRAGRLGGTDEPHDDPAPRNSPEVSWSHGGGGLSAGSGELLWGI